MNKLLTSLAVLLLFVGYSHAQDIKFKLGKVPISDLRMEVYPEDSTADAVILVDEGLVTFQDLTDVRIERSIRIKILNTDGLRYGTYSIPVAGDFDVNVRGFTINLVDGQVETERLRNEHKNVERITDDIRRTVITFPNVRVGSVLDLKYSYVTSNLLHPVRNYTFQRSIPIRDQVAVFLVPEYLKFNFRQKGYETVNAETVGTYPRTMHVGDGRNMQFMTERRKFWAHHMPALKPEEYVNSIENYRTSVFMEITLIQFRGQAPIATFAKDWHSLDGELHESSTFGKLLEGNSQSREMATNATLNADTEREKALAIVNYLKQNYTWNRSYGIYGNHTTANFLRKKEGNVANFNLMLVHLLKEVGLQAYPVILSTRAHGLANPYFTQLGDYNYVLAYVQFEDQTGMFLDAVDRDLPAHMIPFRCLNGNGRLLNGSGGQWVTVGNGDKNRSIIKGQFEINADGSVVGNVGLTTYGYTALNVFEMVAEDGDEARNQDFKGDHTEWEFSSYEYENDLTENSSYQENWSAESYEMAVASGDRIYLNALLGYGLQENPFISETRLFPVNMGVPLEISTMLMMEIPEGYTVESLPENTALGLPNQAGTYRLTISQSGSSIAVVSKLIINQPEFFIDDYPALREFFSIAIAKGEGQIVLQQTP